MKWSFFFLQAPITPNAAVALPRPYLRLILPTQSNTNRGARGECWLHSKAIVDLSFVNHQSQANIQAPVQNEASSLRLKLKAESSAQAYQALQRQRTSAFYNVDSHHAK
jgi:hypothetical protein